MIFIVEPFQFQIEVCRTEFLFVIKQFAHIQVGTGDISRIGTVLLFVNAHHNIGFDCTCAGAQESCDNQIVKISGGITAKTYIFQLLKNRRNFPGHITHNGADAFFIQVYVGQLSHDIHISSCVPVGNGCFSVDHQTVVVGQSQGRAVYILSFTGEIHVEM